MIALTHPPISLKFSRYVIFFIIVISFLGGGGGDRRPCRPSSLLANGFCSIILVVLEGYSELSIFNEIK